MISSTFLALSWFLPELARPSDITITNFMLTWTRVGDVNPTGIKTVPLSGMKSSMQSYTITGLEPETDYNIEVVAVYSAPLLDSALTSISVRTLEHGMSE